MNEHQESQILSLINEINNLTEPVTIAYTRSRKRDYLFEMDSEGSVIGCICVKYVQWYQCEICHLSVSKSHRGLGLGAKLVARAITYATKKNFKISQITIREDNIISQRVFEKFGFKHMNSFFNNKSAHRIKLYQLNLN